MPVFDDCRFRRRRLPAPIRAAMIFCRWLLMLLPRLRKKWPWSHAGLHYAIDLLLLAAAADFSPPPSRLIALLLICHHAATLRYDTLTLYSMVFDAVAAFIATLLCHATPRCRRHDAGRFAADCQLLPAADAADFAIDAAARLAMPPPPTIIFDAAPAQAERCARWRKL